MAAKSPSPGMSAKDQTSICGESEGMKSDEGGREEDETETHIEDEEEEQVDYSERPLERLPPELRLKIYSYIFDSALDSDKPLDPKATFPFPPIIRAWPELKGECTDEWRDRLFDEARRLREYQRQIDEADKRSVSMEKANSLYEEFERTLLKEKQVEVLLNNFDAAWRYGENDSRGRSPWNKLFIGPRQQPWPVDPWSK
jgi:hypothetical protein